MSDFLQPFFLALLSNIPHLSKGFYDFFHAIQLLVKEEKPIKYFLLHLLLVRFGKLLHDDPPNVIYGVHKVSIVTPRARSEANHERRVEQLRGGALMMRSLVRLACIISLFALQ